MIEEVYICCYLTKNSILDVFLEQYSRSFNMQGNWPIYLPWYIKENRLNHKLSVVDHLLIWRNYITHSLPYKKTPKFILVKPLKIIFIVQHLVNNRDIVINYTYILYHD